VSHVFACLQRLGAKRAGTAVPCRIAVRPGKEVRYFYEDLSEDAQSLWSAHVAPQLRRRVASHAPVARFDVRQVCRTTPFLYHGTAGPAAVHRAADDVRHEGLLVVDTSERFGDVIPLDIVTDIEQDGWPQRLVDTLKMDVKADLDLLVDVHTFLQMSGCINRQLSSLFGTELNVGLLVPNRLCSGCVPDGPSLRDRCFILPEL